LRSVLPPADADVDVVALREHPAVAARNRAQLDRGEAVVLLVVNVGVGDVSFERDPVRVAAA
jgi:hypothetical protein